MKFNREKEKIKTPHRARVDLAAVIDPLNQQDSGIAGLFERFLHTTGDGPSRAGILIEQARDSDHSLTFRRLAVLMLEHEALRIWKMFGFGEQSCQVLREIGLLVNGEIRETVLREGYSTNEPEEFASELHTRLARLDRIHERIQGWCTPLEGLRDFIHVSRLDCKLTLARYLFHPEETVRRILAQVRTTKGLVASGSDQPPSHDLSDTAVFDEAIVERLRRDRNILWVAPATPSELNSLIEYPLGTVAIVIKPPGSDREFEIKRAGMRGDCAVDVLFERDGIPVPIPHRMQGTSCGFMLEFENSASCHFAVIHRTIHGVDPPASRILGRTAIASIPTGHGNTHILDYLTHPMCFPGDFGKMRDHLKRCVVAYEEDHPREDLPGEIGWTMRFFNRVVPNQAWITGTSSFRLDRLVTLLSAEGPDSYFRAGLGRDFSPDDERRLADEVLEEVLGVLDPPSGPWTCFRAYVEDALAAPANRARADKAYVEAIQETGRYWGTLLGTGGFSEGESFVTRNVGLKSLWRTGSWQTHLCFMDHDNLHLPGGSVPDLAKSLRGMRGDELWVCGDRNRSMMACLNRIYLPEQDLEKRGEALLRESIEKAFRATRKAMLELDAVRALMPPDYLASLRKKEEVIHRYLTTAQSKAALARWRTGALQTMKETVYPVESLPVFLNDIVRYGDVLRKYAFLFEGEIETETSSKKPKKSV